MLCPVPPPQASGVGQGLCALALFCIDICSSGERGAALSIALVKDGLLRLLGEGFTRRSAEGGLRGLSPKVRAAAGGW